ncbi:MAG: hypothetical protein WBQ44_07285, partial [Rhodococcus sp. (in: high G+C Gram-positive bacteria)]
PVPQAPAPTPASTALRAKGLDEQPTNERLTFSGPDEDGGTAVRRSASVAPGTNAAAQGTRRERREAARTQSKTAKSSRSKKKR